MGSKGPSSFEESMPLQDKGTQVRVRGVHIKDSVGPKIAIFWLKPWLRMKCVCPTATITRSSAIWPSNKWRDVFNISNLSQDIIKLAEHLGPLSITWLRLNIKTVFLGMGIPIIKIRRSSDRLIFIMGISILVRRHLYIETGRCWIWIR